MAPRILVAGIGNMFLGDDGFGPEVARRLAAVRASGGRTDDTVRVVDYGIRGMHLAYDLLDGWDALVIVDAVPPGESPTDQSPGSLSVLEVGEGDLGDAELDAHGMNPVAVLASLGALGGVLPPTYVVGCCPGSTAENIGLSDAVAAVVDEAVLVTSRVVDDLVNHRAVLAGSRAAGGVSACASESQAG